MSPVILRTKRLFLEKIKERHLDDLYTLLSNREVQKFFPSTLNRKETEDFYNRIQERYRDDGYCFLAVKRKRDATFLGICGLLKQRVDNELQMEVGYRFLSQFWGNGYATEAVEGCVQYVIDEQLFGSLIILSIPENKPSINVAKRCGFSYSHETVFQDLTHEIYKRKLK